MAKVTFYFLPAFVGVGENDLTRLHMLLLFLKASSALTDLIQVQRRKTAEVKQKLKV